MSTVVEVATQGRATNLENDCCANWLEDFTVEISSDCITFTYIRDDAGNIMVINVLGRYQVTWLFLEDFSTTKNRVCVEAVCYLIYIQW